MSYWQGKVVLITGASAGLGRALAEAFARRGARLALAARGAEPLEAAAEALRTGGAEVLAVPADVTRGGDVARLVAATVERFGRIDVLVNAAGRSARGTALSAAPEEYQALWELNFLAAVRTTQAAMPYLEKSRGHVVNIGSLASKSAARWMGGYAASKFPLAAFSQQLRLELDGTGVHVLLVCPGPIARSDAGRRYDDAALPDAARQPGVGVKLGAIDPARLSERILTACEQRRPELVVPGRARLLFALAQLSPRLGDWLVRKFTGKARREAGGGRREDEEGVGS